uniref:transposase n=1 Tax=Methylovulum miyakonense TaxID=645578 RepID=UPI0012EC4FE9
MPVRRGRQTAPPRKRRWGRSKGGFGCKIHAVCDALGLPVRFILTGSQGAECRQAIPLLENLSARAVLADKAYDTNALREWLETRGMLSFASVLLWLR